MRESEAPFFFLLSLSLSNSFLFTLVSFSSFFPFSLHLAPFSKKAHHGRFVGRRCGRALLRVHRRGVGARL